MQISLKIVPQASLDRVVGFLGPYLKVQLKGVPEKGKLNDRLIEFLSQEMKIPSSALRLKSGFTSPIKVIEIQSAHALKADLYLSKFRQNEPLMD